MAATLIFHKAHVTIVGRTVHLWNVRELTRSEKKNRKRVWHGFTVARRIGNGLLQFPDTHMVPAVVTAKPSTRGCVYTLQTNEYRRSFRKRFSPFRGEQRVLADQKYFHQYIPLSDV